MVITTLTVIYFSFSSWDVQHTKYEVRSDECVSTAQAIKRNVKTGRVFLFCGSKQV